MKTQLLLLLLGANQLLTAQIRFTEVTTPWNFTGSYYGSVAFADIDNDGDQDLLITGFDGSIQPMTKLYTNDQGEFSEVSDTPFEGVAYSSVAFADVDDDGDQDLLITGENSASQRIAKLYTNEAGVFPELSDTPFEGVAHGSVAFADVDDDGDQDLLITGENSASQRIAKLYNNEAGAFSEVNDTPFEGVAHGSVAFADVDNDGDQDLLITGWNNANQAIAKLYANEAGAFSEVNDTPFEGVAFSSVAFADVDDDGDQDLLITGVSSAYQRIAKLYNNEAGAFSEVNDTPFEGVAHGSVAFADVDDDGDQDLLITGLNSANQDVAKLYTNHQGTFSEAIGTPFVGVRYSSVAFADVDDNGSPDLLLTGLTPFLKPIAKLYTNDTGIFTEKTATPFEGVAEGAVAFADVDNDGDQDLLITGIAGLPLGNDYDGIAKLYENHEGTFPEVIGTPFEGVYSSSVAFADVDDDGDQDLLITGQNNAEQRIAMLYENHQGTFTEVSGTPFEGVAGGAVAFADVDNDGDQDLLITGRNNANQAIAKLYANEAGAFSEVSGTSFEGASSGAVAFEDVDDDGDQDLLITGLNDSDQPIAHLYANQGGIFEKVNGTPFVGMWKNSAAFVDIDSDGDRDLLMAGDVGTLSSSIEFKLYLNEQGSFSEASNLPFEGGSAPFFVLFVLSADVDNDGDPDLLLSGLDEQYSPTTKLYLNDMGVFREVSDTPFEGIPEPAAAFADVDNDEDLDLLLTGFDRSSDRNARLYLNEGLIVSTHTQVESGHLDFTAFPNPLDGGVLFVACRLQAEALLTLQVYNAQGISVMRREFRGMGRQTLSLDVSTLPRGVYFLIAGDGERYGTLKFLIP